MQGRILSCLEEAGGETVSSLMNMVASSAGEEVAVQQKFLSAVVPLGRCNLIIVSAGDGRPDLTMEQVVSGCGIREGMWKWVLDDGYPPSILLTLDGLAAYRR